LVFIKLFSYVFLSVFRWFLVWVYTSASGFTITSQVIRSAG